jgi:S-adenosylmethionine-diacylglycerol 3-amino-3-carboxypropyl transferase
MPEAKPPRPTELAFSQVREDWRIEWQVLDLLQRRSNGSQRPLRVLMVASGGCTALSLLAHSSVGQIDAVDCNLAQLALVELRRQALRHLSSPDQLDLIGDGRAEGLRSTIGHRRDQRLAVYDQLRPHLPEPTRTFWDARRDQIGDGVNQVGRFEQLFRKLALAFAEQGFSPLENPSDAIQSPQWRAIFEQVFERQKLIALFGEAAVNYSMDRSFGEHFAAVFAQAMVRFKPMENYFLTQVWADRYAPGPDGLPLYLQPEALSAIQPNLSKLYLHAGQFVEQLPRLAAAGHYDLIQFSNLSDWMPVAELDQMLQTIHDCLNPGGAVIGRRLNGDHNLTEMMAQHFDADRQLSRALQLADRSFFYPEVVIGWR